MRNLLALFGAAALTFAGVGWYLGWYHIRTSPSLANGHENINIDLNTVKTKADLQKGAEKLEEKVNQVVNQNGAAAPAPQPGPIQAAAGQGVDQYSNDAGPQLPWSQPDASPPNFQFTPPTDPNNP